MTGFIDTIYNIHTTLAWLVVLLGAIAVGALVGELRWRAKNSTTALIVSAFVGCVHLQVLLGIFVMIVMFATGSRPFYSGGYSQIIWHAVLGILAAVLVTVAAITRRRSEKTSLPLVLSITALVCASIDFSMPDPVRGAYVAVAVIVAAVVFSFIKPKPLAA